MRKKLSHMYNRIFHSSTIFNQLVVFTIIVSVVPIVFITISLFQKLSSLVTDDLVDSHLQLAAQYVTNIEDDLYHYENSLDQIANNTIVLDTLMNKSKEKNPYIKGQNVSIEVNKSLRLENHFELRNCMIYSNITENKIFGKRVATTEVAKNETWFKSHNVFNRDFFIYSAWDNKNNIISLIQEIIYVDTRTFQRQEVGFIKLDIYADRFLKPAIDTNKNSYLYDVIVLDEWDNIVYSSNEDYNDILNKLSLQQMQEEGMTYYKDVMVYTDSNSKYGIKFIFLYNYSQFNSKKAEIYWTILPFILIAIFIIVVTAFIFTRGLSKRVKKLVNKIQIAETGNLKVNYEIEGNDEISILDRQFNQMLLKLDHLIKKNYIQRLENKETELRNLQLQINPHFLYNTLETISSIAAVKKVFTICEICEKLGNVFRYSLGKNYGEYVTVKQELEHIQNYIYIQQTRFVNKFDVFYNIDTEVEQKKILRFILQPIVENAIVHGLSNKKEKGLLEIGISIEEGRLLIRIEDDGVGMSSEQVDELMQYINDETITHNKNENKQGVGIRNVNQRIKLACGLEYGLTLLSSPNKGTCFIISLPVISGGN